MVFTIFIPQALLFKLLTMNITVNNNVQHVEDLISLDSLIEQLNIDDKGIAIAVNHNVIAKTDWNQTTLTQDDNITIIKATQGG